MRWMIMPSIGLCAILSLSNCASRSVDSFCAVYQPLVVRKGDGESLVMLNSDQKRAMLVNEQTYRGTCK